MDAAINPATGVPSESAVPSGRGAPDPRPIATDRAHSRDHRPHDRVAVLVLVGAVTLAADAALVTATLALPIGPAIAMPGIADPAWARIAGVAFWTAMALLGSFRVISFQGHGVLTFHLPFILAAIALGGPVAGGWVALLGTFERREFRVAAWYGILYNHVVLALAAVLAGVAMLGSREALATIGMDPQLAFLIALAAATAVFAVTSVSLVVVVVALRDNLKVVEATEIHARSYRDTALAEAIIGWLLAWVYLSIAPWAPIVVFVALLTVWRKTDDADAAERDRQTGVATRIKVEQMLESARRGVQRGGAAFALLYVDMNGLKHLNDKYGHAYGDLLIEAVGRRLSDATRIVDVPGRLGGDEFIVIIRNILDERTLRAVAERIHDQLCEPIAGMPEYEPGAAVGALLVDRMFAGNEASILIATADRAMYEAKNGKFAVQVATAAHLGKAIDDRRTAVQQRREAEAIAMQRMAAAA